MSGKVVSLRPCIDMPAMLRLLADDIERGVEGPYQYIFAVAQPMDADSAPETFHWGGEVRRTELAGALMFAAQHMLQAERR